MQDCVDFVGLHFEFNSDRSVCHITQPLKLQQLFDSSGLSLCRPQFTPDMPNVLVSSLDCPSPDDKDQIEFMKSKPYRKRVGQLLWIARSTRPDIAYQVNALARVAHNPGKAHWDASTYLIRYLHHTSDYGLTYVRDPVYDTTPGQWKPVAWSDATWAPDYGDVYDNYRSTTGWMVSVGQNVVNWCSHRQPVVAQSSTESEWYAAADAAKEAVHFRHMFNDLSIPIHGAISLRCDNQSTIKQSVNAVDQKNSRHIGQRAHFLRQQCNSGQLSLLFVPTKEQRADLFIKCLPTPAHEDLRRKIGVISHKTAFSKNFKTDYISPQFSQTSNTAFA